MKHKNQLKILTFSVIILFVGFSFLKGNFSKSEWGVSDGYEVDFVLDEAEWTINNGESEQTGNGAKYNNVLLPIGLTFEVKVDEVDDIWGIEFTVDNTTDSSQGFLTNDLFKLEFEHFLYYPSSECERLFSEGFNAAEISKGPRLIDWFFVEPTTTLWEFLEEVADIEYHQQKTSIYDYQAYFESEVEKSENRVIFDVNLYGDFLNDSLNIDVQFQHTIKFIWEEDSGILLGYRISSSFSGTFYGLFLSESLTLTLRQTNYSLPNFKFFNYTGFIPGFSFIIGIITLIIISNVVIFLNRRKRTS